MNQEELIQKLRKESSLELQYLLDNEAGIIRKLGNDPRAIKRHEPLFSLAKRELSLRGELHLPDCRGCEDEFGFDRDKWWLDVD
jgi:hypothetical protein